jgi:hypothetical protein
MLLPRAYAASPLWLTMAMKMCSELLRGQNGGTGARQHATKLR